LQGDALQALALLEELATTTDHATVRAALATLIVEQGGDTARAKSLLLADAEKGDVFAQVQLARGLVAGQLPGGEAEGEAWFQRAAKSGDSNGIDSYAYWLFVRKDTPASRARALELWRTLPADDALTGHNNHAWMLCTTRHADVRDPVAGLAAAARMGEAQALNPRYQDTVAACLAAAGRHADAAARQREAIATTVALQGDKSPDLPGMRKRLALYEAGQPYLEESGE
jgi:hypothetical protein